jgi:predicted DNA-binding transcriptional regulator YafY
MSASTTLLRHKLILDRLRQSPATLQEIFDFIELRTEAEHDTIILSPRTFRRDKADILSLYKKDIQYRASDKCYFIADEENPELGERIIEAFNIANMLKLPEATNGLILFEPRRPQGTEHFDRLLEAIRERLVIRYNYHNYAKTAITSRTVHPYALKEFQGRWYLLAAESKGAKVKSFGLDRISGIELTKRNFTIPEDLDLEQLYRDCFGITGPESGAPSDVVLSFKPLTGHYITSFPLHHSQKVLIDNSEELRISLKLHISPEFEMEIRKHGASVRILQPLSFREKIKQEYKQALRQMEDKD